MSEVSLDEYFKQGNNQDNKQKKTRKPKKEKISKPKLKKNTRDAKKKVEIINTSEEFLDQYESPSGDKTRAVIKLLLWIGILLITIRGAIVIINPPRPVIKTEKYIQSLSETEAVKGFAHQFVREYLTYSYIEPEEYKKRVTKYLADWMSIGNRQGWSKVIDSNVWSIKKIDEENAAVTVYVKVSQGNAELKQGTSAADEVLGDVSQINTINAAESQEIREFYVRVPVRIIEENKLYVSDYPNFITGFEGFKSYGRLGFGYLENTTDNTRNEVRNTLDNFFMIYDDGTEEQTAYYMLNAKKVIGYNGQYKFDRIRSIEVLKLSKDEKQVLAVAEILITDSIGTSFEQKFNLIMRKENSENEQGALVERWYIERFVDQGEQF